MLPPLQPHHDSMYYDISLSTSTHQVEEISGTCQPQEEGNRFIPAFLLFPHDTNSLKNNSILTLTDLPIPTAASTISSIYVPLPPHMQ